MPDVLVIGAGPAGSTAALLLARAGLSVTIVEQHRFPRDKVCGECLSALGSEVIDRIGAAAAFTHSRPIRLVRALLHGRDGSCAEAPLPMPMWGLSRAALDVMLLKEAERAGATVLQPSRCERLAGGAAPTIRVRDLESNEVRDLDAQLVLVADGKALESPGTAHVTGDFGIKTHFASVDGPADAIELFSTTGRYGGLAPIEGDRWNAAFSVSAAQLKAARGDVDALFATLVQDNIALARRLAHARRVADWFASPLPRFGVRSNWLANVVPIGNAAAAIEPIGGEGMGLAMRSAELAAEAIVESRGRWNSARSRSLRSEYQRLWRVRRPACRAAAVALSSSRWSGEITPLLASSPRLLAAGMALVGK